MTDKPLSLPMASALLAVARMKGDSVIAWDTLLAEERPDDRCAPIEEGPQQGWKPIGR